MKEPLINASAVVADLQCALEAYKGVTSDIEKLKNYYGSDDGRSDYQVDESCQFPTTLKRCVQVEDGMWYFFEAYDKIIAMMKELDIQ